MTFAADASWDDAELVAALRDERQVERVLAVIIERYGVMVRRTCERLLGHGAAEADDATQQVFLYLLQKAPRLGSEVRLAGWLHATARGVAMNTLRSRRRRQEREHQAAHMQDAARASTSAGEGEERELLDVALSRIPSAARELLIAHYFAGHGVADLAQRYGIGTSALKMRLSSARKQLQRQLKRLGGAVLLSLWWRSLAAEGQALAQAASPREELMQCLAAECQAVQRSSAPDLQVHALIAEARRSDPDPAVDGQIMALHLVGELVEQRGTRRWPQLAAVIVGVVGLAALSVLWSTRHGDRGLESATMNEGAHPREAMEPTRTQLPEGETTESASSQGLSARAQAEAPTALEASIYHQQLQEYAEFCPIAHTFLNGDPDDDGTISRDNLLQTVATHAYGQGMSQAEREDWAQLIMSSLDRNADRWLSVKEYLAIYQMDDWPGLLPGE